LHLQEIYKLFFAAGVISEGFEIGEALPEWIGWAIVVGLGMVFAVIITAKTIPRPTTIAQPIHSGKASPISNPSEMTPAAKTVCRFPASATTVTKNTVKTGTAQLPLISNNVLRYDDT